MHLTIATTARNFEPSGSSSGSIGGWSGSAALRGASLVGGARGLRVSTVPSSSAAGCRFVYVPAGGCGCAAAIAAAVIDAVRVLEGVVSWLSSCNTVFYGLALVSYYR